MAFARRPAVPTAAEPAPRNKKRCCATGVPVMRSAPRIPARATAARRRIQSELADRDPHSVRAEVTEPEDALAARHDDAADVALRPVAEDLAKAALPPDRQVQAARTAKEMAELLTGLADGRRVHDRH